MLFQLPHRIARHLSTGALALALLGSSCSSAQSHSGIHTVGSVPSAVPVTLSSESPNGFVLASATHSAGDTSADFQPAIYRPDDDFDLPVKFTGSSVPSIRAQAFLLIDAKTGRHLASKNAETPRAVASTQKLVTALVVLDAGNLDEKVRVMPSDVQVEPTSLGIKPGEVYTRRALLYAFLVKSCNDVANVLARDNAGSISAFAAKMNAKARSLGCTSSNFKNPHGLTVMGQYSTARDMARIAMAAYRNGTIRDAVRRTTYTFRRANGQNVVLKNTNYLLNRMPGCNGMKTGYTVASGRCLISTASRNGRDVILVQLGTRTKYIWDDGKLLMTWGLDRAKTGGGVAMH